MNRALVAFAVGCLWAAGCANPEEQRLEKTTLPTYDTQTGRLKELTSDQNKNGKIDTWTEMDGSRPVLTRMDQNEDGKLDRWEYYDATGRLEKVGYSRRDEGKPDAWAFAGADGKVERVEISSAAEMSRIDRWETFDAGGIATAEEDTGRDGRADKWETYEGGIVATAAFDENADGRPDRRLTYHAGSLVLIETEPDPAGTFARRVEVR